MPTRQVAHDKNRTNQPYFRSLWSWNKAGTLQAPSPLFSLAVAKNAWWDDLLQSCFILRTEYMCFIVFNNNQTTVEWLSKVPLCA